MNGKRYFLVELESSGAAALVDMDEGPERIELAIRERLAAISPDSRTFRTADVTDQVNHELCTNEGGSLSDAFWSLR